MLLLLLLLMVTDTRRALLLMIVHRCQAFSRLLLLMLLRLLMLIHTLDLLQSRLFLRPRGPLVSVVTELSWLLIVLLVDHVLEGKAQGARITVKPQGLL